MTYGPGSAIRGSSSASRRKNNCEGLAIGSALARVGLTIGENGVGMDPGAVFEKGCVVDTVDLKPRLALNKEFQRGVCGTVIVQANVEDRLPGVQEYAIEKPGAECVELKWGQGAKDIGGEAKIRSLAKARMPYRGYIVPPNPVEPTAETLLSGPLLLKALPRRNGNGRVLRWAERRITQGRRQVLIPEDRAYRSAYPARATGYASKIRYADRGGRQRHQGGERLAHDE